MESLVKLIRLCPIRTGTATSAPGLGSPLPHLRRVWAHPCHICAGSGRAVATSAPGLRYLLFEWVFHSRTGLFHYPFLDYTASTAEIAHVALVLFGHANWRFGCFISAKLAAKLHASGTAPARHL